MVAIQVLTLWTKEKESKQKQHLTIKPLSLAEIGWVVAVSWFSTYIVCCVVVLHMHCLLCRGSPHTLSAVSWFSTCIVCCVVVRHIHCLLCRGSPHALSAVSWFSTCIVCCAVCCSTNPEEVRDTQDNDAEVEIPVTASADITVYGYGSSALVCRCHSMCW